VTKIETIIKEAKQSYTGRQDKIVVESRFEAAG